MKRKCNEDCSLKRSMMQVYVVGSGEAVELYLKAFDARLQFPAQRQDRYDHAELDICGQILAVSEASGHTIGDNMQFCLEFHARDKDKVAKAYDILKEGAIKALPPDSCEWSPCAAGIIDKFGVNWCIYIAK